MALRSPTSPAKCLAFSPGEAQQQPPATKTAAEELGQPCASAANQEAEP